MSLCVEERQRVRIPGRRITFKSIWHLADGEAVENATYQPIVCSEETGIVMPGPQYEREPTCPDCLKYER